MEISAVDWIPLTALVPVSVAVTWIWRLSGVIATLRDKAQAQSEQIAVLNAKISLLEHTINDFKVTTAEKYVSRETLSDMKSELLHAVGEIRDLLNRILLAKGAV